MGRPIERFKKAFEINDLFGFFNNRDSVDEYRRAVQVLAREQSNLTFMHSTPHQATIVIGQIFKNATTDIKIFAGDLSGDLSISSEYFEALNSYLISGKRLELLLERFPSTKSSLAYDIISKGAKEKTNIAIRVISQAGLELFKQTFNNGMCHFVVGDSRMYTIATDNNNYKANCNFNDIKTSQILVDTFNNVFASSVENVEEIYNDTNFKSSCKILIPDFENINLELIEYFSKHPDDLHKLDWRKFEMLLETIFRNQGFKTHLGPGRNDGGIDLRLLQKDSIGQILTLVQAKKYKKENPIRIEAVQALSGIVECERANRGLFVTTSRYLPGVEKWVSQQPTKIILANAEDISKWCKTISENGNMFH